MAGAREAPAKKVLVWDLPVRVFHWTVVGAFAIAWLTAGGRGSVHELSGYVILALVIFRIWWGFAGTKHARFADFFPTPRRLKAYFVALVLGKKRHHLGHNPIGALMIFTLLALLAGICASGWMMLTRAYFGIQWVRDVHTVLSYTALFLLPLHVLGAILSSIAEKQNLVLAMITGRKRASPGIEAKSEEELFREQTLDRLRSVEAFAFMSVMIAAGTLVWFNIELPEEAPPPEREQPEVAAAPKPSPDVDRRDYVYGVPPSPTLTWMLASGGRLYDKWYAALRVPAPRETHPRWPASNTALSGAETWRCKNCHGWDYRGRDGQYARGKHRTGIRGIRRAIGWDPRKIVAILGDANHRYTNVIIPPDAKYRVALFVSKGQHNTNRYIRRDGSVRGSRQRGKAIFQNLCAICHGFDGKKINFGTPEEPIYVGTYAKRNPWEVLHKIRNGFPGKTMVALRAFRMRNAVDVLSYAQTLPTK